MMCCLVVTNLSADNTVMRLFPRGVHRVGFSVTAAVMVPSKSCLANVADVWPFQSESRSRLSDSRASARSSYSHFRLRVSFKSRMESAKVAHTGSGNGSTGFVKGLGGDRYELPWFMHRRHGYLATRMARHWIPRLRGQNTASRLISTTVGHGVRVGRWAVRVRLGRESSGRRRKRGWRITLLVHVLSTFDRVRWIL
jgi:hypothetical protein